MTEEFRHYTVLLKETVDGLQVKPDGVYVDCTLGGAGHSEYLLTQLNEHGHLYAFDQDQKALAHAKTRLQKYVDKGQVTFIKSNFRNIKEELAEHGVFHVDGILYDLGVSSPQLDEAERGFSYHQDAPLDMRMDQDAPLTAREVVNTYSYSELVKIFFRYGAPARRKGGHPAKRIFQAIRIAVNDELGAVEESLEQAIDLLAKNGRISVITFHSLEDRIVKTMFKEYSTVQDLPPGIPVVPEEFQPELKVITRKPILPSDSELSENNRSRSAKLRIAEKIKSR